MFSLSKLLKFRKSQLIFHKILLEAQKFSYRKLCVVTSELLKKPKKPKPVFMRYFESVKPQLSKSYPNLHYKDIVKTAGEMWRKCSENEKKPFEENFYKDWKKYLSSVKTYESQLSENDKLAILSTEVEAENKLLEKKLKQKLNELGKPKRPVGPFSYYLSERKSERTLPTNEWLKQISNEWKNMSIEQKEKFIQKSRLLKQEYPQRMTEWKNKIGDIHKIKEELITSERKIIERKQNNKFKN